MTETPNTSNEELQEQNNCLPWNAVDALYGIACVAIGSALLLTITVVVRSDSNLSPTNLAPLSVLHLLMLFSVWAFGLRKSATNLGSLGILMPNGKWKPCTKWLSLSIGGLVASLLIHAVYALTVSYLGVVYLTPPEIPAELLGDGLDRLISAGVLVIIGPFAEELFFRGFILAAMIKSIGIIPGITVTSLVFAISHGEVAIIVPVFASGVILSLLYIKTGSLWPPLAAHSAQNYLAFALI